MKPHWIEQSTCVARYAIIASSIDEFCQFVPRHGASRKRPGNARHRAWTRNDVVVSDYERVSGALPELMRRCMQNAGAVAN